VPSPTYAPMLMAEAATVASAGGVLGLHSGFPSTTAPSNVVALNAERGPLGFVGLFWNGMDSWVSLKIRL
jgi:hypothetical protein